MIFLASIVFFESSPSFHAVKTKTSGFSALLQGTQVHDVAISRWKLLKKKLLLAALSKNMDSDSIIRMEMRAAVKKMIEPIFGE